MDPERVYDLLERTAALLRAEERRLTSELALHPVHLHTLRYLARCNRYSDTPAAVAEYLGVTKGTASQTILILKQRGYVESSQDADDRRKQHLRPTRLGDRVVRQATPPAKLLQALKLMPKADASLEASLDELLRTLQRLNDFRPFGLCKSCRHLQRGSGRRKYRCGLTGETLGAGDTQRICREYQDAI